MSETPFPFPGDDDDADDERGSRRLLLLAGGLAVAAALGLGGVLLLDGGDEEDLALVAPPVRTAVAPTPSALPTALALPRAFDADLGRNPFKALYVVPAVQAPAPAAPQAVVDPTLPEAPSGPAAPAPGVPVPVAAGPAAAPAQGAAQPAAPAGPGSAPAPAAPAAPTDREHALVLRGVSGEGDAQRARFTIDGEPAQAAVGQSFGPTGEIRLISLQEGPRAGEWTAVLQVGDGEPFDVVTGQAVSVR